MRKLAEIPAASVECNESPEDEISRKVALARRLESQGHQTIAVGRALVTIERSESPGELPREVSNWGVLKVSIYSDPDVSGDEAPMCLYIDGSRYGLGSAFLQTLAPDGRERIFKLEERLIRADF